MFHPAGLVTAGSFAWHPSKNDWIIPKADRSKIQWHFTLATKSLVSMFVIQLVMMFNQEMPSKTATLKNTPHKHTHIERSCHQSMICNRHAFIQFIYSTPSWQSIWWISYKANNSCESNMCFCSLTNRSMIALPSWVAGPQDQRWVLPSPEEWDACSPVETLGGSISDANWQTVWHSYEKRGDQ